MATKNGKNGNGNGVVWASELARKYTSGVAHMFVLHYNVRDYAANLVPVENYLLSMLSARDIVIQYDVAGGIRFQNPKMREDFIMLLGLDAQAGDVMAALGLPGQQTANAEVELPKDPGRALPLLEQALHLPGIKIGLVISWAEMIAPNAESASMSPADRQSVVTLARWATDPQIIANGGIVILVVEQLSSLAMPLRASTSRIEAVAVPLPDESARLDWIQMYLEYKAEERAQEIEAKVWESVRSVYGKKIGDVWYWNQKDTGGKWENMVLFQEDPKSAPAAMQKEVAKALKDARRQMDKALPQLKLEMAPEVLARMTSMLCLVHIEDIFLRSLDENAPVTEELVKDRKDGIIAREFGEVIEVMNPQFGLELIAGHNEVKSFMANDVIRALREGDRSRAPQGVLLVGPPGTGKTALVEAVAYEAGFNAIELNLARILGSYVGMSERNLERALLAIQAMAPAIVFVDEIDQKLGRRAEGPQGDSGVGARLFSRVMEFISDTGHRGRIVFLGASNRPDLLDAAFTRPGRFDAVAPLLPPSTDAEREELFRVMLLKYGFSLDPEDTRSAEAAKIQEAAAKAAGYTGAEIEAVILKANKLAGRENRPAGVIHPDDILRALDLIKPSTRDIEFMTMLALNMVNDLELIPEAFRRQAADKEALQLQIAAKAPTGHRSQREL